MAGTAPEVGRQTGELMGFPCEEDAEDQTEQNNHMDSESTCDLNGHPLGVHVPQDRESEPQELDCNPSEMSMRSDSNMINSSLEASQEMSEGQAADSSQLPLDQEALPTENIKRKRGRPRKRLVCNQQSSKDSDAELNKETSKIKAPAKLKQKVVSELLLQTPLQHNSPAIPESPEMTPSGRPKRRAAKVALEYLQKIHKDLEQAEIASTKREDTSPVQPGSTAPRKTSGRGRGKGRKRKAPDYDSDCNDDADFNPEGHVEVESEEDNDEEYGDSKTCLQLNKKSQSKMTGSTGFSHIAMQPVWASFRSTKEFRDEHCSPWVFSEWLPSVTDWHLLSISEAEKYLPEEEESMTFMLSRDGIKGRSVLQRVKRFGSLPPHSERWDSLFFAGGPVWAMEWCPCPEGAADQQYTALYCNRGMDDRHKMNTLHTEHALLQLWDLGSLQMSRPSSSPRLAYALAVNDGCIWNLKWCPSGAWELPTTNRKTPHMPRLGLIAAAFSNGSIAVYSLPHPEALMSQHPATGEASQAPLIYRVKRIMTLKLGSNQADHGGQSGQCFALDWLPVKPHNVLAAGFYDGMVALWDLRTRSPLQKVRAPDRSVCLYPYHCFLAHDNTVRCLSWCKASSELLVTVGDDRKVNLWDLSKTCTPLKATKRFLPTEVSWPLLWSGVFLAQECCYTALGQQGLHYLDSGYFGQKPFFVCTRKATVWSLSMSDWLNSCVVGDNTGDLVCSLLCDPNCIYANSKRHRFPVYRTEMVPRGPAQGHGQAEEEQDTEAGVAPQEEPQSYKEAVRKYYLHFNDMDLRTFSKYQDKPIMKQLHASETKGILSVDQMPLNALYKVRFNPNMSAHGWVLSAGQSGLVRVHCVRGLSGAVMHKLVQESQAQFNAMFHSQESDGDAAAVRCCTADTVQV